MNIKDLNTQPVTPQQTTTSAPAKTKTTEEVLKSAQQFRLNNQQNPPQRAYDVKVESQSSKTGTAIKEKTTAVSALQTADEGMKKTEDTLKKMQSLVEKATDKNLTTKDREGLQKQYDDLSKELDKNSESTKFNGHKLLDGKFELETNTSNNKRQNRDVSIGSMSAEGLGVNKVSLLSAESAAEASKSIKKASDTVSAERKVVGAEQKILEKEVSDLTKIQDFKTAKKSGGFDKLSSQDDFKKLFDKMKEDMLTQSFDFKNNLNTFNASRIFTLLK